MLGIPEEHRHLLRQYSLNILGALDPVVSQKALDAGNTSVSDFGEMLKDIVDHRRNKTVASSDGEILMSLILGEVELKPFPMSHKAFDKELYKVIELEPVAKEARLAS